MNTQFVVRQATPQDAKNFVELHNKVWKYAYSSVLPEEVFIKREELANQKIESFSKTMQNTANQIVYVAEKNGELIGLMFGVLNSEYEYFNKPDYADLQALYIHPNYQNMGIGTALKNVFISWAKQNGKTKFVIGVLKENYSARKVYESWGGKLENYSNQFFILNKGYDEVFYTYILD